MPQYPQRTIKNATTLDANWTTVYPGLDVPMGTVTKLNFEIIASDYTLNYATWVVHAAARRYQDASPTVITGGAQSIIKYYTGTTAAAWDVRLTVYNDLIHVDVLGGGARLVDWIVVAQDPISLYGIAAPSSLLTGLVSYWTLDETSTGVGPITRADSHASNHLTDNNTVANDTGVINNGASLVLANSESLSVAGMTLTEPYSFSFWGWINAVVGTNEEFLSVQNLFCYVVATTGDFRVQPGTGSIVVSAPAFSAGVWHHVACRVDGSNSAVFLDGVKTTATTSGSNTGTLYLGRYFGGEFLDGKMDEVGLWGRALTDAEAATLYSGGMGLSYPF